MAEAYQGPLTEELLEQSNYEIARIIAALPDDAEIIETPMMDHLVYKLKDYDRILAICERAITRGGASALRVAQLKIAMVNAERRKLNPNMVLIRRWMIDTRWVCNDTTEMPGVRRTMILFYYNAALFCRLSGDFQGEAENHKQIADIAEDEFSRNNAAYMVKVAMRFHHAKEGTTKEAWKCFLIDSNNYRARLRRSVPREAQWMANEWGHRVQLAILLGYVGEEDEELNEEGFDELVRLLSIGVSPSASYTAELIIAMTLFGYGTQAMACWEAERIIHDEAAGNEWRMLAALLKAQITGEPDDYRAAAAMPGNGICHAARAVAEHELATWFS
ncbi:MAG: hypothetical protein Q8P78_02800 [bacterium]|nr:hypothetical protein [bacterium]